MSEPMLIFLQAILNSIQSFEEVAPHVDVKIPSASLGLDFKACEQDNIGDQLPKASSATRRLPTILEDDESVAVVEDKAARLKIRPTSPIWMAQLSASGQMWDPATSKGVPCDWPTLDLTEAAYLRTYSVTFYEGTTLTLRNATGTCYVNQPYNDSNYGATLDDGIQHRHRPHKYVGNGSKGRQHVPLESPQSGYRKKYTTRRFWDQIARGISAPPVYSELPLSAEELERKKAVLVEAFRPAFVTPARDEGLHPNTMGLDSNLFKWADESKEPAPYLPGLGIKPIMPADLKAALGSRPPNDAKSNCSLLKSPVPSTGKAKNDDEPQRDTLFQDRGSSRFRTKWQPPPSPIPGLGLVPKDASKPANFQPPARFSVHMIRVGHNVAPLSQVAEASQNQASSMQPASEGSAASFEVTPGTNRGRAPPRRRVRNYRAYPSSSHVQSYSNSASSLQHHPSHPSQPSQRQNNLYLRTSLPRTHLPPADDAFPIYTSTANTTPVSVQPIRPRYTRTAPVMDIAAQRLEQIQQIGEEVYGDPRWGNDPRMWDLIEIQKMEDLMAEIEATGKTLE